MKKIRILLPLALLFCLPVPSAGALSDSMADYAYTGDFRGGLAAVCQDGKWGAVDRTGAVSVPLTYDSREELPILLPEPEPSPPLYSENLAVTHNYHTGLYGYTDINGHVVIGQLYDYAAPFHNGFARVMRDGLWGFVDTRGCEAIPLVYQYARDFDAVGAWVQAGEGRFLIPLEYARQCSAAFQPNGDLYVFPSPAKLLLNARPVELEAYEIGGSNYVKLRDVAALMSGAGKSFSVGWNAASQTISVTSGAAYTPAGGELEARPRQSRLARFSTSPVLWDGREIVLCAYQIDGNTFFRLRDLMALLDVSVGWDHEQQLVSLDPARPYEGSVPAEKLPDWRLPAAGFDLPLLYNGNAAGQVECLYRTVEYRLDEMPAGLYGIGVLNPAAVYDSSRDFAGHVAALDSIVRQAFHLSVGADGVLRDADGTPCFSVLHDGERLGLTIEAWRSSAAAPAGGAPYQNAALEMLQYLSGSDEVGAALWSLVDALQLRLPGSTEDFGFTGFEGGGQTGVLVYRTGARVRYDMRTDGEITFWFE